VNCPNSAGQINYAKFCSNPSFASPDYFNSCTTNTTINTPNNVYGNQLPKSGNAYAGVITYLDNTSNFSEYIQCQMSSSLLPNQQYCVSFFINLADSSSYASNDIGVFLSPTPVSYSTNQSFTLTPIFANGSVNINKINWSLISFSFTASGGELYFLIGNFKNNTATSASPVSGAVWMNGVYFFIDDISLTQGPCFTGIKENYFLEYKVYPNPSSNGKIYLSNLNTIIKKENIKIFNYLGEEQKIKISEISESLELDFSESNNGVYLLQISKNESVDFKKITINN